MRKAEALDRDLAVHGSRRANAGAACVRATSAWLHESAHSRDTLWLSVQQRPVRPRGCAVRTPRRGRATGWHQSALAAPASVCSEAAAEGGSLVQVSVGQPRSCAVGGVASDAEREEEAGCENQGVTAAGG